MAETTFHASALLREEASALRPQIWPPFPEQSRTDFAERLRYGLLLQFLICKEKG
jgi:hypothetical protein